MTTGYTSASNAVNPENTMLLLFVHSDGLGGLVRTSPLQVSVKISKRGSNAVLRLVYSSRQRRNMPISATGSAEWCLTRRLSALCTIFGTAAARLCVARPVWMA